jgi:hypothetical protein
VFCVFTRFPGFFDNVERIPPLGIPKERLQITGKPELHSIPDMDVILEMPMELSDNILPHGNACLTCDPGWKLFKTDAKWWENNNNGSIRNATAKTRVSISRYNSIKMMPVKD